MPRKKELPAPDSGEQDDLLSTEPQESPDAPLTEPQEEPIPTESPPDEGAPEDDAPSEEYTEFLQALNEAPAQEDPQPVPSDEAEPLPSEEEPALTIPAEEPFSEAASSESPSAPCATNSRSIKTKASKSPLRLAAASNTSRHCEEQRDAAIHRMVPRYNPYGLLRYARNDIELISSSRNERLRAFGGHQFFELGDGIINIAGAGICGL